MDIITKGFLNNSWFGIEHVNVIANLHLQARDRKSTST
jgi:hypothetical protein